MKVMAVDPGPVLSAYCVFDGERVLDAGKLPNEELLPILEAYSGPLAIEMIASYGMAVGAEVFETCVWIGRFLQVSKGFVVRVPRLKVKLHLCHSPKAKDANVRQALIDRLGPAGTKKSPGPTFGLSGDMWAALAVAAWFHDTLPETERAPGEARTPTEDDQAIEP